MGENWHDHAFLGLHFDIHATQQDRDLGKDASKEHLLKQFDKIHPDFVQCDCKGHPGIASYPTQKGVAARGIVKDALREWREAARERGIPLIVHFSGVYDIAVLEQHPDWGRVAEPGGAPDKNYTCPLSPYTSSYMIPQLLEIIREYDVDGFWVDGESWASKPCYCQRCMDGFRGKTGYPSVPCSPEEPYWEEWLAYSRENFTRHVALYTDAIHREKPGCTSCSNWMYTVQEPDPIAVPVDYISGDFAWMWSCANALTEAKFLDTRGKKWDLMAWAFTSYGPMESWVFKSVDALCQEAGVVMANGGAFTIYDTPNRWGTLVEWHMDDLAEVAKFCRARQSLCQDTDAVPQAAILHNSAHYYANNAPLFSYGGATEPLEGALHILTENGIAANILTDAALLETVGRYPLCILPEQTRISEELRARLLDYVVAGGRLIVSGVEPCRGFSEQLGVEYTEEPVSGYYGIDNLSVEVGRRTVPVIGQWGAVRNRAAETALPLLGSRDAGEARRETGYVAATVRNCGKGKIAGIYGPVFEKYHCSHYPMMREFFRGILDALEPVGLVRAEAPPCVSISVRRKAETLLVHFVNLGCDPPTAPRNTLVERVPDTGPVSVRIPLGKAPDSVILAPENRSVRWRYENGLLTAEITRIGIHDILVVEMGSRGRAGNP